MGEWYELRFWYSGNTSPDVLFEYKRTIILLTMARFPTVAFFVLDEPQFLLLRIHADANLTQSIRKEFEKLLSPHFSQITMESWSAIEDTRARILAVKTRLANEQGVQWRGNQQGWIVRGRNQQGGWAVDEEDLGKQVDAFATFMTRVLGCFTHAYLAEMPYRVEDRWLMSVFLHLMLDSISTWHQEEEDIRQFPFL